MKTLGQRDAERSRIAAATSRREEAEWEQMLEYLASVETKNLPVYVPVLPEGVTDGSDYAASRAGLRLLIRSCRWNEWGRGVWWQVLCDHCHTQLFCPEPNNSYDGRQKVCCPGCGWLGYALP